jgi:hypothetical protein
MGIALKQRNVPNQGMAETTVGAGGNAEIPEMEHLERDAGLTGEQAKPWGVILNRVAHHHG